MRFILFILLVAVLALLAWAVMTKAYVNNIVFILGAVASGLCGYLLADYFFSSIKRKWHDDADVLKKENIAAKQEVEKLTQELEGAIPAADMEALRHQLKQSEEEKKRIHGEYLAQTATIAGLTTRLEKMQEDYKTLKEETTVTTVTDSTEMEAIRDTLSGAKTKISELMEENKALKKALEEYKIIADQKRSLTATALNDDLKIIEGIGEKIEKLLIEQGITTWVLLADTSVENLRDILQAGGEKYMIHDPTTWPQQARFLAQSDWEGFYEYIHALRLAKVKNRMAIEPPSTEGGTNQAIMPNIDLTSSVSITATDTATTQRPSSEDLLKDIFIAKTKTPNPTDFIGTGSVEEPILTISPIDKTILSADIFHPPVGENVSETSDSSPKPHPVFNAPDDLKVVGGIGPKIEILLKEAGIVNWQQLSECSPGRLRSILDKGGSRYRLNDPTSWPLQAKLLAQGEWERFQNLHNELFGGKG